MDNLLKSVFDLPDVSFIENDNIDDMMKRMVQNYEKKYKEITGQTVSLGAADPNRIHLYANALEIFQLAECVDRAGKQDLLKYTYGAFLDHAAAIRSVTRQQPSRARTTIRFTLSEPRDYAIGIPAGTRVTNGDGVYFITQEYSEAAAGAKFADVDAICTEEGIKGNKFLPGQINVLVDPLPYIKSIENITETAGGTVVEDDNSLKERTYLAPSGYSTAGPRDAYIFWAKTYNAGIGSVKAVSPSEGCVTVYILMKDGALPQEEILNGLEEFLRRGEIRPLTEFVKVEHPQTVNFDISLSYTIDRSNQAQADTIQSKVEAAADAYIKWQTTQIGRDIDPTELIRLVRDAGAKNPIAAAPLFQVVKDTEVAQLRQRKVEYRGLQDD